MLRMIDSSATHVFRVEKKHRFRFSLPLEVAMFGFLLVMAIAGGFLHGPLRDTLILRGGAHFAWFCIAGTVAMIGLAVSLAELLHGERLDCAAVRWIAYLRMWLNVMAIGAWIYMGMTVLQAHDPFGIAFILATGIWFSGFHVWSAVLCKRLYIILSPGFHTSQLEARLARGDRVFH